MKYDIASQELETLKANIEEGRDKSETLLERLKAILEGTDLQIAEIRKEAFDFGRFLSAAENGRIGKYDAEKLSKYMMDKLKQKETLIDKLQSKNVSLRVQISKAETQIKHKEEMGDDLKFIDFHSLQIENKQNVKNIDEKNKRLLKEKASAAETTAELQERRNELKEKEVDGKAIEQTFVDKSKKLMKKQRDIDTTQAELDKLLHERKTLIAKLQMKKEAADPIKFIMEKNKVMELHKSVKNWKRKIEIAELEARKARAILKARDVQQMSYQYQ